MSLKSSLGLDGVDLTIHVVLTGLAMVVVDSFVPGGRAADAAMAATLGVSVVLLALRRTLALRRQGNAAAMEEERVAQLEERVSELEAAQQRVMELEERVDFTERLLARERDLRLGAGRED